MTVLILLSAGVGAGLWALWVWLIPPRPPLDELVTRLRTEPDPPPIVVRTGDGGWAQRLGRPFVEVMRILGLPQSALSRDLAITERSAEVHLAEKAALALTGLLLPTVIELLLALGDRPLPWTMPLAGALALAVGGFLLPDAMVRSEAAKRRTAFRHALGAFLNLVHLLLAGGSGVDGALTDAAGAGHGWAFQQLSRALDLARLTRTSPWQTLGQLGDELEINELSELAAALSLAGTEGAKVRASLAAKAAALRHQGGSDAEAAANAATERMTLPAALMAVGFIVFVFYPALTNVTSSL
ncbi:type II secretion system F family protein [Streptomyces violaceusniger]|uniref:type II secretion system F family protein n=1 Tax=Streptomyces violaceusniger TaxID=68280 RepID=UPI0031D5701A